jgi:DHA1 family tetracycline resistance protein-like MFS transporter
VSHLPPGDWRIGAPFYFCAAVQLLSMLVATRHFRRERQLASQVRSHIGESPDEP